MGSVTVEDPPNPFSPFSSTDCTLLSHFSFNDFIAVVAHALPAMVFFFLFLFTPLLAAFLLTVYVTLCKPGCAVSAADTSSV